MLEKLHELINKNFQGTKVMKFTNDTEHYLKNLLLLVFHRKRVQHYIKEEFSSAW